MTDTTAPKTLRDRLELASVEFGTPMVVSILLLPFIIQGGSLWPFHPNTIDLDVYHLAVLDMVNGRDIYLTSTPIWNLKFIYPPIAAVLMTPLLLGPYWLWQLLWTGMGTAALVSVLRRCRVPRGWVLAFLATALVIAMEPIRTTLGYGQINTMLMALVVIDLLPSATGTPRRIPAGMLIGLAAAIKLTPLLFVIFALLIGRRAMAGVAAATFALLSGLGFLLLPSESAQFWRSLGTGDVNTAGPIYVGNQAMTGVFSRWFVEDRTFIVLGLLVGLTVAALATIAAAWWWRRGERAFAIGLVGMGTCIGSPLSWTHHHVWAVILLVAVVLTGSTVPLWARWMSLAWMMWIALFLPLAVFPFGGHVELEYSRFQDFIANLGPVFGSVLLVAVFADVARRWLTRRAEPVVAVPEMSA